jgi:hypothetical protein
MWCSPPATVNVDRLKPFHARADDPPAPGPVSDQGQEGEHEVELLLSRKEIRGVLHYLARWRGGVAATLWRTTSGCGLRSWLTARSGWLSTTLPPSAAGAPARPPARRRFQRGGGCDAPPGPGPGAPGRVPVGDDG